jgi:VanZ family protein
MTKRKKLLIILLAFWLCVIWGNSMLSREISGAISDFFQLNINEFVGIEQVGEVDSVPLRKLAHFAEFSVLGILLSGVFKDTEFRFGKSFLYGAAAAMTDEAIQVFSKRGNSMLDVLLDCSGVFFGILLILLFERHKKDLR